MKKITIKTDLFGEMSGDFESEQQAIEFYACELKTDESDIEIVSAVEIPTEATAEAKAQIFGTVTLINADTVEAAKDLIKEDFKRYKLKMTVCEEVQPNLFFCSTDRRIKSESYYIYVVLN